MAFTVAVATSANVSRSILGFLQPCTSSLPPFPPSRHLLSSPFPTLPIKGVPYISASCPGAPKFRVGQGECSLTISLPVAMSFWTCSSCTFVNEGKGDCCDVCQQPRKAATRRVGSSLFSPSRREEEDNASKWGCRACTFLNKDADKVCDICGTPKSEVSLDAFAEMDSTLDEEEVEGNKFWPLRSCAASVSELRNTDENLEETRETSEQSASTSLAPSPNLFRKRKAEDEIMGNAESDQGSSGAVSNSLLGQLHLERISRIIRSGPDSNEESPSSTGIASASSAIGDDNQPIIILTYNVWFREDLQLSARMNAIGAIILEHKPHLICFQEVTPNIYKIFQQSAWWGGYQCSVNPQLASRRAYFCLQLSRMPIVAFHRNPFPNTIMGRELCIAKLDAPGGKELIVATTHLESPCPAPPTWNQMYSPERVSQAEEAFRQLQDHANVVFGGDMNWDDKLDGIPPLPKGWCDAWMHLRTGEEGLTYDSKANPMLTGSRLQKRLDRIFCHLQDFKLMSIEMVGTKPIPGATFQKEKKVKKQVQQITLPVLPSDHFGLLLKFCDRNAV